jgi:hypothetical protein
MHTGYTLEWLDSLITVSLNPEKIKWDSVQPERIEYLNERIEEERNKLQSFLNNQVFELLEGNKIRLLIGQYHSTLFLLLEQSMEHKKHIPANRPMLKEFMNALSDCLNELLSFIESRFAKYIDIHERVSVLHLSMVGKSLRQRIDKLKPGLKRLVDDNPLVELVLKAFDAIINLSSENPFITFQEIEYKNDLLSALERFVNGDCEKDAYTALHEMLILRNFNSQPYIAFFIKRLAAKLDELESATEKMDQLLYYFDQFNRASGKTGVALNPKEPDLKTTLAAWFRQEIFALKKEIVPNPTYQNEDPKQKRNNNKNGIKVRCNLSTDQIGLILRAADETRILTARSMNEVFRTIVPYLSTSYKKELSFDSVRSKSYAAESRDKEKAIDVLKQIIEKISRY